MFRMDIFAALLNHRLNPLHLDSIGNEVWSTVHLNSASGAGTNGGLAHLVER